MQWLYRCLAASFFVLFCSSLPVAATERPLRVGFVYTSPASEEGWSYAHDQARKALENIPGVKTFFVESVPEGHESERIILEMARKGYDIIFTTSYGYMDFTLNVAKQFPRTVFLHCSGYKTAPNVSTYFGRMYQARFLTGLVAGSMTKKNIIGYVAAFPIPEVIRGINAFALGVRTVNPKAVVRVQWTQTWYDPLLEKKTAQELIRDGADILAQHQDSPAPQEAAEEKGLYSIGYNTDMSPAAPKGHLVAAIWNWEPFYRNVITQVRAGTWQQGSYWPGFDAEIVNISPFAPIVPEDVRAVVERYKNNIRNGKYTVFEGPVKDQNGYIRVAKDAAISDAELLSMDWFVEGVIVTPK